MILFNATSRRACALSDDKLTTGSVGIQVEFTFSDDWTAAPARIAVFRGSGVSVDVALLEDSCTVPPEVLTQPGSTLTIGVYGTDGANTVVIPTVFAEAGQIKRGTEPSGVEPTPQTQPLIDQLLAAAQAARNAADEAERLAQSVRDDADDGEFDGTPGNSIWTTSEAPLTQTSLGQTIIYYTPDMLSGRFNVPVLAGDIIIRSSDTVYYVTSPLDAQLMVRTIGSIKGTDGKSAYQLAVDSGYVGTEEEWLASLHGQNATVDDTLSHSGQAADAAETGKVKHTADYALLYAETLNSGAGIPLDARWERGGINSYGANDSRKYRARTVSTVQASVAVTVKAASGYQFFAARYNPDGTRIGVTDWLTSRELPVGESWRICVRAYPENADATADPEVFGAAITIQNNIGSGGGGGGGITVDDALSGSSANPVQNKVIKAALDEKANASDVPTKTSDLQNDSGYLTQHQSLAAYRTSQAQDEIDRQQNTAIAAKYTKPGGGIPKTDMAEDVKTSLGKADTALQQHQDISCKLDKNQGTAHADEFLVVGADGNITTQAMTNAETEAL